MLKRSLKLAVLLSSAWIAQAASAGELTLFTGGDFSGREITVRDETRSLQTMGFNDRASSLVVHSGTWEVCMHANFGGECRVYEPGEYRSLDRFNGQLSSVREIAGVYGRDAQREQRREERRERRANRRASRDPELVLFDSTNMRGRSISVRADTGNLTSAGFNDQAQSMVVEGGTWEVCQHRDFGGACRTYAPGTYNVLEPAFHRSITSIRMLNNDTGRGYGDGERDDYRQREGGYRDGDTNRGVDDGRRGGDDQREGVVQLYSEPGFRGESVRVMDVNNLKTFNFNDRAGSVIVTSGEWQFCEHANFGGQCMSYGPGRYDRLGRLHGAISSLRRVR